MTDEITQAELDELKRLLEEATPEPIGIEEYIYPRCSSPFHVRDGYKCEDGDICHECWSVLGPRFATGLPRLISALEKERENYDRICADREAITQERDALKAKLLTLGTASAANLLGDTYERCATVEDAIKAVMAELTLSHEIFRENAVLKAELRQNTERPEMSKTELQDLLVDVAQAFDSIGIRAPLTAYEEKLRRRVVETLAILEKREGDVLPLRASN